MLYTQFYTSGILIKLRTFQHQNHAPLLFFSMHVPEHGEMVYIRGNIKATATSSLMALRSVYMQTRARLKPVISVSIAFHVLIFTVIFTVIFTGNYANKL